MKIFFASLLILFGNIAFYAQSILTKNEYAVYATVLRNIYKDLVENEREVSGKKGNRSFVILDKTKISQDSETSFDETFHKLKVSGITNDFIKKNKVSAKLQKNIRVNYQYDIVDKNEVDRLLELGKIEVEKERQTTQRNTTGCADEHWRIFHKNYQNSSGYYQFSRVGFSLDKTFAYVEIYGEGGSWQSNMRYILRKIRGKWKIEGGSGGHGVC